MANKKNENSGIGLTWVILLLCVAFIGFILYRSKLPPGSEGRPLLWNTPEDAENDLFSPNTASDLQVTEESAEGGGEEVPTEPLPEQGATEQTEPHAAPEDPLLTLVSPSYPASGEAPELVWEEKYGANLSPHAAAALRTMLDEGSSLGLRFVVSTSYRSIEKQQEIFDNALQANESKGLSHEEAYAATVAKVLPGGHSEHCTGLAVDIVSYYHQAMDEAQENTPETRWLQSHCWEYGFILRYPKDKTTVTGLSYEPWHYRYVGEELAKYLTENKLTPEEYLSLNS